eukprot:1161501-Pelagomonas_calceolata.AAC.2
MACRTSEQCMVVCSVCMVVCSTRVLKQGHLRSCSCSKWAAFTFLEGRVDSFHSHFRPVWISCASLCSTIEFCTLAYCNAYEKALPGMQCKAIEGLV